MTGYDRFMTAFEKMTISKKLGKSRLCGYVYDRNDRNDSFFSLLHVRAYIYNSFLFVISDITDIEKEKRRSLFQGSFFLFLLFFIRVSFIPP